ncbi:MAG: hypothetical protein GC179_25185 [Anaerolineaceae bacterium]|nr:hypothetical protein [Anaerolineaceae bacterium]
METAKLQLWADRLKYDSNHMLDEHKRNMAALEWFKVEAELKKRRGFSGIFWQVKKLFEK